MNPCSQDLLQFSSLSCVIWSKMQEKVIQTAEKATMSSLLKEKESASSSEAFLPTLVDRLGAVLHFFEPDHHFFLLTVSSWNLIFTLLFTVLIFSDNFYFLFGFLHLWCFPCSWTLTPFLLWVPGAQFFFSCLDFSSSTCCNHIVNIREREKLEAPTTEFLVLWGYTQCWCQQQHCHTVRTIEIYCF